MKSLVIILLFFCFIANAIKERKLQLSVYEIATVYNMTDLTGTPNCPKEKNQLWSWTLITSELEDSTVRNPWIVQVEAPFYFGAIDAPVVTVKNPDDTNVHFRLFYGRSCSQNEIKDSSLPCASSVNVTLANSVLKSGPILQTFCDDKIWLIYSYKWLK